MSQESRPENVAEAESDAATTSAADAPLHSPLDADEAAAAATTQEAADGPQGDAEPTWTPEQVKELKEQSLRLMADMENLRRRHTRDLEDARKYAMTGFARDLLEVVDNLGRALSAVPKESKGESQLLDTLVVGVEMTERTLMSAFERHQIKRVRPERGEKFDPSRHQAMFEVPTAETPAGCIAEVMQPGYVLADRLLRPALVGVAKAVPPKAEPAADTNGAAGGTVDTTA